MIEPWLKCSAPECSAFGLYVFRRKNAQGQEVSKRACGEHRDRGEAWLAKGAHAGDEDAVADSEEFARLRAREPAQGSLL